MNKTLGVKVIERAKEYVGRNFVIIILYRYVSIWKEWGFFPRIVIGNALIDLRTPGGSCYETQSQAFEATKRWIRKNTKYKLSNFSLYFEEEKKYDVSCRDEPGAEVIHIDMNKKK